MVETKLQFKKIELSDKPWIDALLKKSDFRGSEYCFGNNFIWADVYSYRIGRYKDFYLQYNEEAKHFAFPAGEGDLGEVVQVMMNYAKDHDFPFVMHVSHTANKEKLEALMPGRWHFEERQDYFDYIYTAESLITLKGKKLHSKRNFINRFIEKEWSVEPITSDNIKECEEFNQFWCVQNNCCQDEGKREEMCAARKALKYFDVLGFKGCILKQEGRVVAYSIGERINSDTMIVHIEKADAEVPGAYPMINKQFATMFASDCTYVNREEDMGVEGLRKAKMSYNPVMFTERYRVTLND